MAIIRIGGDHVMIFIAEDPGKCVSTAQSEKLTLEAEKFNVRSIRLS